MAPLNIGIDATRVGKKYTGIERFTLSVLRAVADILPIHDHWMITVFTTDEGSNAIRNIARVAPSAQLQFRVIPQAVGYIKEQCILPFATLKPPLLDIFYSPGYPISPFIRARKIILQVHDIVPWCYKDTMTRGGRSYWRTFFPLSILKADRLLVDSRFTSSELAHIPFARGKEKEVLYPAIDDIFFDFNEQSQIDITLKQLGIQKPYLLAAGSMEPRKNLAFLLDVFESYLNTYRPPQLQLVLVGGKGWSNQAFYQRLLSSPFAKHIVLVGWLEDRQLVQLMAGAQALLYPSLYEGFGLPPVEALALGTPVIASNVSSMPEVLGNHALYASPTAVTEWVTQIGKILTDESGHATVRNEVVPWIYQYSHKALAARLNEVLCTLEGEIIKSANSQI